jgi:hypothetical protein
VTGNNDPYSAHLAVINQENNEASIIIGDDIEGLQLGADTERSAVKVSMIRMNNEIIYQDGQLIH